MKVIKRNKLFIHTRDEGVLNSIRNMVKMTNPKYIENQKFGRSNWKTDPLILNYENTDFGIVVPRGAFDRIRRFRFELVDETTDLPLDVTFCGTLRPYQEKAVNAALKTSEGLLCLPTGSGKTVIALYMIAARKQTVLIVVHTKELLYQWIDRISTFLNVDKGSIAVIGDGKYECGDITVGIINSVKRVKKQIAESFGHVIVDECHRVPSTLFTDCITDLNPQYILGLTATPIRRDKLDPLIFLTVGEMRYKINQDELAEKGGILSADVFFRRTLFKTTRDTKTEFTKVLTELMSDLDRNLLIRGDIVRELKNFPNSSIVALTDRKSQGFLMQDLLIQKGVHAELMTGDLGQRKRKSIIKMLEKGQCRVLIATGALIGEGFDCDCLHTIFLMSPIAFKGRLVQYVGRILRPKAGKNRAKIYDYVDARIFTFLQMAMKREKLYESKGFNVAKWRH